MAFRPANCPNCGGSLQVPDDKDIVNCMYCSTPIIVRDVIKVQTQANLENLFKLAVTASNSFNNEEAYGYYTQILEHDGKSVKAWLGKGVSAGWLSTLSNFRLDEMVSCFENAIQLTDDSNLDAIKENIVDSINSVAIALFNISNEHLNEFASLDNVWEEYLDNCLQIISVLETAYNFDQQNVITLRNIIDICYNNISGVSYVDESGPIPGIGTRKISIHNESLLKEIINKYEKILKEIDSSYIPPKVKKAGSCFVITATMGDSNHQNVLILQRFRDELLVCTKFGRKLIMRYNEIGPILAYKIEDSYFLRKLSYFFIVLPAKFMVLVLLKIINLKHFGNSRNNE